MTLSRHVVSLALAQRMKVAGFEQETECYWRWNALGEFCLYQGRASSKWVCAAPLASEVVERLPHASTMPEKWRWEDSMMRDRNGDWWHNSGPSELSAGGCCGHKSWADALALIWLALNEKVEEPR